MKRLGLGIGLGLLTLGGIASACFYGTFASVHFHAGQPDFGTLPRRGVLRWKERDIRPLTNDSVGDPSPYVELQPEDYAVQEARDTKRTELQKQAFAALETGGYGIAYGVITKLGAETGWTGEWFDLYRVMGFLGKISAEERTAVTPFVRRYAAVLKSLMAGEPVKDDELLALANEPNAGFLRPHALYQYATARATANDFTDARRHYSRFLSDYPDSPLREQVLIMMARGAVLPQLKEAQSIDYAKTAMNQLEHDFPQSRYKAELPGLRARLLVLDKQYGAAFASYLKRGDLDSARIVAEMTTGKLRDESDLQLLAAHLHILTTTKTYEPYYSALREIRRLTQIATPAQVQRFTEAVRKDPALASDYLYYRLYHTVNKPAELKQLAAFAEEVAQSNVNTTLTPDVLTRFAEAAYKEGAYARAITWADRSLMAKTTDRALYVRGASRHHLKKLTDAARDFEDLISDFPKSPLIPTARENAALVYESLGRYDKALDTFFALSADLPSDEKEYYSEGIYRMDIAYLLDARMSTAQVAAYVRSHANHAERDLIVYTLGIRSLRDEKWSDAEQWLKQVPAAKYTKFNQGRKEWGEKPSPDPLIAVRNLKALQGKITAAKDANARAKAQFDYASYYSTHGTLLLYNPALWNYGRAMNFGYFWNNKAANANDEKAVRQYMYQHEAFARSRALCQKLVAQYPNAPIVPNALFRHAAATRRLAQFNQWWNRETTRAQLWNDAISTLNRITQKYPKHPVAAKARKYAKVFQNERKELAWERRQRGSSRLAAH